MKFTFESLQKDAVAMYATSVSYRGHSFILSYRKSNVVMKVTVYQWTMN